MITKKFTYEDMEEAYEFGYARAQWEEASDRPEEPDFRMFMQNRHGIPSYRTFSFRFTIKLPLDGLMVCEKTIHAQNVSEAIDYFNNLNHKGEIVNMSMCEDIS